MTHTHTQVFEKMTVSLNHGEMGLLSALLSIFTLLRLHVGVLVGRGSALDVLSRWEKELP